MTTTYVIDGDGRAVIPKDPDATLDYSFDFSAWLALINDTIASASITVEAGLTKVGSETFNTTAVSVNVAGGIKGKTQSVRCRITTANGRIDDRTVWLRIDDR